MVDESESAHLAAATETAASGLGLLAAALSSIRTDDVAAHAGRQALAPFLPVIGSVLGRSEDDHYDASAECRSCPVCRLLAMTRLVAPDVVDGLGHALDAVMVALREGLEEAGDAVHPDDPQDAGTP